MQPTVKDVSHTERHFIALLPKMCTGNRQSTPIDHGDAFILHALTSHFTGNKTILFN